VKKKERLILEFTEFNLQRLNPESTNYPMPNVMNKELSVDAWDRHQSAIQSSLVKLSNITSGLSGSSQIGSLRSKIALETQNIKKLIIQRIIKKNNNWDVYVKFEIEDKEYYGVVNRILDISVDFSSEVFKDTELLQPKEWKIKTKGIVINLVKDFLIPSVGYWILLRDECEGFDRTTGEKVIFKKGTPVRVKSSELGKVTIEVLNKLYDLRGENSIYFKWWFEPMDDKEKTID